MLQQILSTIIAAGSSSTARRPMTGLILTPTRELALQVRQHLVKAVEGCLVANTLDLGEAPSKAKAQSTKDKHPRSPVNIIALTGGMSIQKQKRQLSFGADMVVATPGRIWDICSEVRV